VIWSAVAERSGDTALGNCCASSIQSGVAATALHKSLSERELKPTEIDRAKPYPGSGRILKLLA